jgi:hypothetical protein
MIDNAWFVMVFVVGKLCRVWRFCADFCCWMSIKNETRLKFLSIERPLQLLRCRLIAIIDAWWHQKDELPKGADNYFLEESCFHCAMYLLEKCSLRKGLRICMWLGMMKITRDLDWLRAIKFGKLANICFMWDVVLGDLSSVLTFLKKENTWLCWNVQLCSVHLWFVGFHEGLQ